MPRPSRIFWILGLLVAITATSAQSLTPLASKSFPFTALPTQAQGDTPGPRGRQFGFNNCNSSTAGPNSNCQTLVINSLSDLCLWGTPGSNEMIADTEAEEVAYCLRPERGGRSIRDGAILGAQFLYAENYIQLAMIVDQTAFGLAPDDQGGELDPHGDDEQGNPQGSLVYTNAFSSGDNAAKFNQRLTSGVFSTSNDEEEIQEWILFIGGNTVCAKACTNTDPNRAELCNHVYDEIGCSYNAVADYSRINGTFTVCDSTDMDPPGVFTDAEGQLTTWAQPWSGSWTVPYTPTQVSSSNCFTYQSTQLFASTSAAPNGAATPTPTGARGLNGKNGENAAGSSRSGSAGGPAPTAGSGSNAAVGIVIGPITILVGAMLGAFVTIFA